MDRAESIHFEDAEPVGGSVDVVSPTVSQSSACTQQIYNNTVDSGSDYFPGAGVEALDYGTSPGGTVCRFSFAYSTAQPSNPGTITIRFYSGTSGSSCPGSFLAGWVFNLPAGVQFTIATFDIPTGQEFSLPPGAFGYSYTMSNANTGPWITSGGSGNQNQFWRDCFLSWFGGSPHAGFYMQVHAQDPTPPEIRVEPASLNLDCPGVLAAGAGEAEAVEALGAEVPEPPAAKLVDDEGLIAAAFQAGQARVDVIVNLVPPRQLIAATNFRQLGSLRVLQREVSRRQDAVLNALAAGEFALRHRYENIAGFSGGVSQRGLQRLLADPRVESVQPVRVVEAYLAQGLPLMNALASRSTYDGAGMSIAIVDTGIDYTHPRLGGGGFPNSKVIGGFDFGDMNADPMDCHGHGTACAGLAAGNLGTVGDYIGGVAPGARLYALKITSSAGCTGSSTDATIAAAWDWCVTNKNNDPANPIMVISTSFGGDRFFNACDTSSPAVTAAANNAVAAGITVLASSGNDGYCDSMGAPACVSNVVSVGAVYDAAFGLATFCVDSASCAPPGGSCPGGFLTTDATAPDKVTGYSNTAGFLDLFAPSHNATTTGLFGGYDTTFGGTSAACPYAAGAVAALQHASFAQNGSYLTPAEARSKIASNGDLVTDTKVAITKPRVNLGNAISDLCQGQILSIHNDGAQTLEVASITKPAWVMLDPAPPYSIGGGGLQRICVTVDYDACSGPQLSGTLAINSNDPAQPVVNVDITADCPPLAPASASVDGFISCDGLPGTLELSVSGGGGDAVHWFTGSCGGTFVGAGNPLILPSPAGITTYYARWENTCGASSCASVVATVAGDLDGDGDVDGDDVALFTACATGANVPYDPNNLPPGCNLVPSGGIIAADLDGDGDVDLDDFAVLQRCYTGP